MSRSFSGAIAVVSPPVALNSARVALVSVRVALVSVRVALVSIRKVLVSAFGTSQRRACGPQSCGGPELHPIYEHLLGGRSLDSRKTTPGSSGNRVRVQLRSVEEDCSVAVTAVQELEPRRIAEDCPPTNRSKQVNNSFVGLRCSVPLCLCGSRSCQVLLNHRATESTEDDRSCSWGCGVGIGAPGARVECIDARIRVSGRNGVDQQGDANPTNRRRIHTHDRR